MEKDFLLTYSVTNNCETTDIIMKDKADRVRRDIAALTCWEKLRSVETTFFGTMDITGSTDSDKKSNAKENVCDAFIPILKKYGVADQDVIIHCAIMVESISGVYEFEVWNV
ncbi:hypothetical protein J2125_003947 [Erwinia toletana]|uniref:Uncharacterized protein n=1 Tax=Winslowiella toletana TaxID=92490 RepID=A0ABS4PF64_9GAMM|nr:hypothetical protein [Winslowiella toletana]MBP2170755.1 hypothetical protein [Winslowiella toletana]